MTGEQELDTDSVENKTANELVSSTTTWNESIQDKNSYEQRN
jgi:hypothetical protein